MGLDFIRGKKEKFVQKRDESKGTELATDLLSESKRDTRVRRFRCVLTDLEANVLAGTGAIARVMSDTEILIVQHARNIGHVVAEDVADLIEAMRRNQHLGGILSVTIVDEPDFNGEFTVRSTSPFK